MKNRKRCRATPGDVTDKTKQHNTQTTYDQERKEREGKPKRNKKSSYISIHKYIRMYEPLIPGT